VDKDAYIMHLETVNRALADKLTALQKKQRAKHTEISLKWRAQCFYWKRVARELREERMEVQDGS
jgi:hypothetical protein